MIAVPLGGSIDRAMLRYSLHSSQEHVVGVKKTGKGRRKLGRKKRRMRAKIRHRKG
jgi:hypothetical protein